MAEDSPSHVKSEAESTDQSEQHTGDEGGDDAGQKLRRNNTVSRAPSSHITRVDEGGESSASESGSRKAAAAAAAALAAATAAASSSSSSSSSSRRLPPNSSSSSASGGTAAGSLSAHSVETVDRGVGPTPLPPAAPAPPASLADVGFSALPPGFLAAHHHHHPHPLFDPRNGLPDLPYGLGYPYPALYPTYINQPLPLSSNTLEGRYHFPPPTFHQSLPGLPPSPVQSDISMLSMRSPESLNQLAHRIQWEQLQRSYAYHTPGSGHRRGFSPAALSGLPLGPLPLPGDFAPHPLSHHRHGSAYLSGADLRGYLSGSELRGYASGSDVPPTPGSGSITLPGSLEGSRLASPRSSIIGRNRKRALSHSPISDYLDIQSLTRSSEGSLQLPSLLGHHHSRSSSAASGSYGHLSAASLGTSSPHPPLPPNPYFRHGPMMPPPFFYPPLLMGRPHPGGLLPPPHGLHLHQPPPAKFDPQISTTVKDAGSSVVSSSMDGSETKKSKIKKEAESIEGDHEDDDDGGEGYGAGHIPQEGEPDFIETNCHWEGCAHEFETQDELVKHINQDHIQANKKSFVCRWKECSREAKPFKAQYMLVVHMRRHTGEKPHRCTFEGCSKAYSRLENLKTHLRSHTGEKPYLCEFPGCTKAFSNASDRAKHQNRTHSNAKPYACKASGCTKRYTDPSSLRKHVKTVHGPEFYANKKHKGDGCRRDDPDQDHDGKDDDGGRLTDDGLTVTSFQGGVARERRRSHDTGSGPPSQPSPQSSPEVNVTCGLQSDVEDQMVTSPPAALSNSFEEEVDIPLPDEAEMPGGSSSGGQAVLTRRQTLTAGQVLQQRMKGRLNVKGVEPAVVPRVPSLHSPGDSGTTGSSFTDITAKSQSKGHSPLHKRISDLSSKDQTNVILPSSRRNSNTSTLSSYMSSMRSETSPFPHQGSKMSSRRSSEASQVSNNRLSINNSPYEYDITGNRPHVPAHGSSSSTSCSRRSSESSSSCQVGAVSAMMQKTSLGPSPNLVVVHQQQPQQPGPQAPTLGSHLQSSSASKYSNERLARYFAARKDFDASQHNENSNESTATTSTTTPHGHLLTSPVPDDVPGNDNRRASDPCRAGDPEFDSLRRLQRFNSLNVMKPGTTAGSVRSKSGAGSNFNSSRSSLATEFSMQENTSEAGSPGDYGSSFPGELDGDLVLDKHILEDSEDMIIPDDMQEFLNERYCNNPSQPTSEDMQRCYNERYHCSMSGSGDLPSLRQPSQMSFVGSAGTTDSGCGGSHMSGNSSSSISNFGPEPPQVSPALNKPPLTPYQGPGHFSPSHCSSVGSSLHVQTGFDSNMSSPLPASVCSPYSNQAMASSPLPQPQPQPGPGSIWGQGRMQGPGRQGPMSGCFSPPCQPNLQQQQQQQQPMGSMQPHHHHHNPHLHLQQQQQQYQSSMMPMPQQQQQQGMVARGGGLPMMSHSGHLPTCSGVSPGMAMNGHGPVGVAAGGMTTGNMNVMGMGSPLGNIMPASPPHLHSHPHHQCPGNMGIPGTGPQQSMSVPGPGPMNQWVQHGNPQSMMPGMCPYPQPGNPMMDGDMSGQVYGPLPKSTLMDGGGSGMMGCSNGIVSQPMGHRCSPQVQVPHISQSQIPPNAKAVSRSMMMPSRQDSLNMPLMSPPIHQPMVNPQAGGMYANGYSTSYGHGGPHPQAYHGTNSCSGVAGGGGGGVGGVNGGGGGPVLPPPNAVVNGAGMPVNSSFTRHQHLSQSARGRPGGVGVNSSSSHNHSNNNSNGATTPTGMFRHPHPPLTHQHGSHVAPANPSCHPHPRPVRRSPHQHPPYPYPMEMSPGCNQVTSSTDRKDPPPGSMPLPHLSLPPPAPIEDFMDNITSLSSENLADNLSDTGSNSVFGGSLVSFPPHRTASSQPSRSHQGAMNSGYNPLLNTSNMVVNDMSSMLTQLAEENKYLSMRI